ELATRRMGRKAPQTVPVQKRSTWRTSTLLAPILSPSLTPPFTIASEWTMGIYTTLVVSFANLPSHLSPQVLNDLLVVGLMAYGTQPNLIFAIPSGVECLAAPCATVTIIPHHSTIAQQILPCASVAAEPDHFFWAQPPLEDLLAEADESGNVLISKHTDQPLCQFDYGWAEFFLPDFDETPTPHHFTPLPNTVPFQSDHQLTLAVVASPQCPKLCTAVAQSVAQFQNGLPTLFFSPNFHESICSDILKLFDDAKVAVMNVAMLASFNLSAKITCHSTSLFTQLPEACKEAEVLLAAFVKTLSHHYLDKEVENSYYADLHPHYVDAPTPGSLLWS
ncbi:hypothetical protein L0F63_005967, partial [Massospora cicadina]